MPFQISIQPSGHTLMAEDGASILRAAELASGRGDADADQAPPHGVTANEV